MPCVLASLLPQPAMCKSSLASAALCLPLPPARPPQGQEVRFAAAKEPAAAKEAAQASCRRLPLPQPPAQLTI